MGPKTFTSVDGLSLVLPYPPNVEKNVKGNVDLDKLLSEFPELMKDGDALVYLLKLSKKSSFMTYMELMFHTDSSTLSKLLSCEEFNEERSKMGGTLKSVFNEESKSITDFITTMIKVL